MNMSKELEALKKIANHVTYQEDVVCYYETIYTNYHDEVDIVKQALERNEPMKLVTEGPGQEPTCKNCFNHEPNKHDNYCANCGQRLSWGIDEEEDDDWGEDDWNDDDWDTLECGCCRCCGCGCDEDEGEIR